jgi:PAS domain S-box-containing protein
MLLDPSGSRLEHSAAPSLPASYHDAIRGRSVNPEATPCSAAVYLKEQVIVTDAASDPRWDAHGWRALASAHGLSACWSTPILATDGTALGTFALYGRQPGGPTAQLQNVIGQMTHVAAVAIERARTTAALQESEERFRRMADAISEVIWITDLEPERVLYASPSFERIWGLTLDALYANPRLWTDPIHSEDRARVINTFAEWIGGDGSGEYDIEFRVIRPDGATRWIHERGVLIVNEQGKPYRASGISTDVTERRRAEEERRRHEAILAEAERISLTGSSCWRLPSGELIWSQEMYRIFDFDPNIAPTADMVRARIHPDDLPHFDHIVEGAARDGSDFAVEPRLQMADGTIKHLQVLAHAFRDDRGNVIEFIGAVKDVTQRKESEDALHQVRSELAHVTRVTTLGELTASIAHELNQPLLGIVTNADTCLRLLAEDPPDLDGARDTARRTLRDGDRAAAVITRLRALFKKKGAGTETFDVNEAIQEILVLMRSELNKSRIALQTELGSDVPLIMGDRVQLQQVILNLILNACEAMSSVVDHQRQLFIATQLNDGDHVQVAVRDSGVGLDPATRDQIFQPFYTSKREGMGMGLSISRSIVESHRGRLRAESNEGPGATFMFTIPRAPNDISGEMENRSVASVDV